MQVAIAFMVQNMEAANKTDEIMARFRPIAPKPTLMLAPPPLPPSPTAPGSAASSNGAHKHSRQEDYYILPPYHLRPPFWWPVDVGTAVWRRSGPSVPNLRLLRTTEDDPMVRLSLAVSDNASSSTPPPDARMTAVPMEHNLLSKLKVPTVITPRPARPLRTTICIDSSNIVGDKSATVKVVESKKTMQEVEAEVEHDARPAIVSDCHNRVLLVNDAYKAMVGQPVCMWLDALPGTGPSRRINGEVVLNVQRFCSASQLSNVGGAFPCTARISWERDGAMASLTVPCAVECLTGNSSDNYHSIWRFDSARASIVYCLT
ncbi:hypothetical protein EJB05_30855, partial [Eragrostis curvula]